MCKSNGRSKCSLKTLLRCPSILHVLSSLSPLYTLSVHNTSLRVAPHNERQGRGCLTLVSPSRNPSVAKRRTRGQCSARRPVDLSHVSTLSRSLCPAVALLSRAHEKRERHTQTNRYCNRELFLSGALSTVLLHSRHGFSLVFSFSPLSFVTLP